MTNMKRGILSENYQSLDFIKVDGYSFIKNFRDIEIGGSFGTKITNNYFEKDYLGAFLNPVGTYLSSCTRFRVEDNTYTGNPNNHLTGANGIIASASTYISNIYNNNFAKLHYPIRAHNLNPNLMIECNETTNQYIVYMGVIKTQGNTKASIYKNQGICSGFYSRDAGNTFGFNPGLYTNDQNLSVNYYHRNTSPYIPIGNTAGSFNLLTCSGDVNQCASHVTPPHGNGTGTGSSNSIILSDVSDLEEIYEDITEASTQEEEDILQARYDMLYGNILIKLLNRIDTIIDSNFTCTVYNTDMTDIIGFMSDQQDLTGHININLVVAFLNNENYSEAQDQLNEYKTSIGGQLDNYGKILQLLIDHHTAETRLNDLDPSLESDLWDIEVVESEKGFEEARALLALNFDEEFDRWAGVFDSTLIDSLLNDSVAERKGRTIEKELEDQSQVMSCRPNPFSNSFDIEIHNIDSLDQYQLMIHNIEGKLMRQVSVSSKLNSQRISVNSSDFQVGIFICSLFKNGRIVESVRIAKKE